MKSFLIIIILFSATISFGQKTEFATNKEKAQYELRTQNIQIKKSIYDIKNGPISDSLKKHIIELMERKKGFLSVEFINDERVIVEHQENLTEELIVKNLNRYYAVFVRLKPKEFIDEK